MATPWDRRTNAEQTKVRDAAIARQLQTLVGPFSPFWRDRLQQMGVRIRDITSGDALHAVPAVGERDVCPTGDASQAARLVLQVDEAGWALTAGAVEFRKGLAASTRGGDAYKLRVEAASRPVSYHFGGRTVLLPIASTRDDLDLQARAGARLWSVLGLTNADVLVSGVPVAARLPHTGLQSASLAAGAPALFPGDDAQTLGATLGLVPATVLALPTARAAAMLRTLGAVPSSLATVLLVGPPDEDARAAVADLLPQARALVVWGPDDGRVLYGESSPGSGLVTYPDLEVLDLVDPFTGENAAPGSPGELVVTQLGFAGTALLRWRTGAVLDQPLVIGVGADGRTVPRIATGFGLARAVDPVGALPDRLRAIAGVSGARVERRRSERDGAEQLLVHVSRHPGADAGAVAVAAIREVRGSLGRHATQVVLDEPPPGL